MRKELHHLLETHCPLTGHPQTLELRFQSLGVMSVIIVPLAEITTTSLGQTKIAQSA